jgi:hypothetical protein
MRGDTNIVMCEVSSHRCLRHSTSYDLMMSTADAAIVAGELPSRCGLLAKDHCLVASMHAGVDSLIDDLTVESCRSMTMSGDLARGGCDQSSSKHEARWDQRVITSVRSDANIVVRDVGSVQRHVMSGNRQLGMARRDAVSNGRHGTSDHGDVNAQWRRVSLHWCSRVSRSHDLMMSEAEAAIVACELRSRCGFFAKAHCLVATMHAYAMSITDGPPIESRRSMTMTCGLARGSCQQSSSTHDA